jgi:putative endonuclease
VSKWHVYMIRTRLGTLYTGTATDVERRLAEHRQGGRRGSRYLRSRGPLELVYRAEVGDRSTACKAECRLKALTKREKEEIVSSGPTARTLLDLLGLAAAR